jgi:hypothetical protein
MTTTVDVMIRLLAVLESASDLNENLLREDEKQELSKLQNYLGKSHLNLGDTLKIEAVK